MLSRNVPNKAYLLLPLGLIAISFSSILIKLCTAPVLTIAAYRLTIASVFFISINKLKRHSILAHFSQKQLLLAVISGLFLTLHFATWIASLKYTSVASSVVLVQTAPIFVAIGSSIFLKEKISKLLSSGIMITIIGSSLIAMLDVSISEMSLRGDLLAVAGAIGASGYLLLGRVLRSSIDTFTYAIVVYSVAAVCLLCLAVIAGSSFSGFSLKIYILLFAIAFVPQVIGHTTINWSLEFFSASTVSVIILAEPVGATILAYFLLGESVSLAKIFGAFVILAGVLITLKAESKEYQFSEIC